MKQIVIVLATLAAFISPAQADGLYTPPVPADTYEAPAYAFTGFGLGIDGGGQFGSAQINDEINIPNDGKGPIPFEFDGIAHDGLIGGAHLEYLFGVGRFRFGADIEGGFSNADTTLEIGSYEAEAEQKSYYGPAFKAGAMISDSTLLFVRIGYDWSQWTVSDNVPANADIDADVGSWSFGGGMDTMVDENWSLGLDARYLSVNDVDTATQDLSDLFEDSEIIRAKARLTRRF